MFSNILWNHIIIDTLENYTPLDNSSNKKDVTVRWVGRSQTINLRSVFICVRIEGGIHEDTNPFVA